MMPVPSFPEVLQVTLPVFADQQPRKHSDLVPVLGQHFQLTEADYLELLPSGKQFRFHNRIGWALQHLTKAQLLQRVARSTYQITPAGYEFIKQHPNYTIEDLESIPSYLEFIGKTTKSISATPIKSSLPFSPEEQLADAYSLIRKSLAEELHQRLLASSPQFFEQIVVELLVKMGYGGSVQEAGAAIGKPGDEGIDGVIKEDKLGLDMIYVQAKRWQNNVGRPQIQAFVGALAGQGAKKGVFITTGSFTPDAKAYSPKNETKIVLIDGQQLADLMIEYGLGVTVTEIYELKRIDSDYFEE